MCGSAQMLGAASAIAAHAGTEKTQEPEMDPDVINPPVEVPVYRNGEERAPIRFTSHRELESFRELAAGLNTMWKVDFDAADAELTRRALDD